MGINKSDQPIMWSTLARRIINKKEATSYGHSALTEARMLRTAGNLFVAGRMGIQAGKHLVFGGRAWEAALAAYQLVLSTLGPEVKPDFREFVEGRIRSLEGKLRQLKSTKRKT